MDPTPVYNGSIAEAGAMRTAGLISSGQVFTCLRYREPVTSAECRAKHKDLCSECATGASLRKEQPWQP